ncbi:hypothetical protein AVEN_239652-1 [Araneus ventricosus]|uniref:Uncharacterized protein n=1 Tax=Araneus ventricosus TaxID=182803 RepID=A0A4Y2CSV9_ARAVE|nr:hypothetical protein AVEN_239652-1 [Araneus ventricosus]
MENVRYMLCNILQKQDLYLFVDENKSLEILMKFVKFSRINVSLWKLQKLNVLTSRPFQTTYEGYFGTNLVILNHGQMTGTTPDLALHFGFRTTPAGRFSPWLLNTTDLRWNRVSGYEPSGSKAVSPYR